MDYTFLAVVIITTIISVVMGSIAFYIWYKPRKNNDIEINRISEPDFQQIEQIEKVKKLVEEWEGFDLCAPGNAIGSAAHRCNRFQNCHECLLEYAYTHQDAELISERLKVVNDVVEECKREGVDVLSRIIVEKPKM